MKKITLIDKAFTLKRTPIFSNLDLDLLLTIADKLGFVIFEPDETIFINGEEAHRLYFIYKGEVEIKDSKKRRYVNLFPGDFFGEEALFNEKQREYEAVAKTETQLLTLSRTNLLTIISECPSVAIELLQVYTTLFPIRFVRQGEHS